MSLPAKSSVQQLVDAAIEIEAESAKEAGARGYIARSLVQATLPHKDVKGSIHVRRNGHFTLTIIGHTDIGLPYGVYPRLLLIWITSEAKKTKSPVLKLGRNLSKFMDELGLIPAGGPNGTIRSLRDQMMRLFSSTVSLHYGDGVRDSEIGFRLTKAYDLWWGNGNHKQATLWSSTITLSQDFFDEIMKSSVVIDMRAVKALKRSPMALDIYCWLTYQMFKLNHPTVIRWEFLMERFGSNYAETPQGRQGFRRGFEKALIKVLGVYSAAKAVTQPNGLKLSPSPTHIPRRAKKPQLSFEIISNEIK